MVDIWLPYGRTDVCVRVPTENFQDLIKVNEKAGVENAQDEIETALKNPIDARLLTEIVKAGDKAALVLDAFDASMVKLVVSSILRELSTAGLKNEDLTVIFTYNPLSAQITKRNTHLINELSPLGVNVILHDYTSSENVHIGETPSGVKIYLNKDFIGAKVKILVSIIEPNPYTLYSGGIYSIIPGLSSSKTIEHLLLPFLEVDVSPENLNENPIYRNATEAQRMINVDFAINIVRNIRGEIVKAFAGDLEKSFHECVNIIDAIYKVPVEKSADAVFVSPGGFPFDANLFEACKCVENALRIVKRNGVIVLLSECSEGYGDYEFYKAISRFKDPNLLERSLRKNFSISGFLSCRFLRALQRVNMYLTSAIPDYYISEVQGLKVARTANEALRYTLEIVGKRARISAIPHGNLTIPLVKNLEKK